MSRRAKWRRYWERVMYSDSDEELRRDFWKKGETIGKLLAFFDCIPSGMYDAFVGLVDYSYEWE